MVALTCSGKAPLVLEQAEQLAHWSSERPDDTRWHKITLYDAGPARFACHVVYQTQWQGEDFWHWSLVGSAREVADWLESLAEAPWPPRFGFPPGHDRRQAALEATLRTRFGTGVSAVLGHDQFVAALAREGEVEENKS